MPDGFVLIATVTIFLCLWGAWLFVEIVGSEIVRFIGPITHWIARKIGKH
jgi:hypothetical protein